MSGRRDAVDQDRHEPGREREHRTILEEIGRQVGSSFLAFDRSRVEPLAALRCTLGVAIPLAVAIAAGQPGGAVFIAVGAVSVGFGSFQGAYRSRAAVMLLASAAMALSVFAGSLTGTFALLAIAAATLWSFGAGLLVAFGAPGAYIGLQSTIAVIVADAYPADLRSAVIRAAMVMTGGLVQTLFVVSIWPLRRFRQERRITSQLYHELAQYARTVLSQQVVSPPDPSATLAAALVRTDPHPFARYGETLVFQALIDEAERLRGTLAALSLGGASDPTIAAAADVLEEIARAIAAGRAPGGQEEAWGRLERSAEAASRTIIHALLMQLHAAWHTAEVPVGSRAPHPSTASATPERRQVRLVRAVPTISGARDALTTLRANLTLQSSVCRHALRLAVGVGIATALYRLADIPRGYWVSMTTLLVLRPEFRETFVTGGARIAGTVAGGVIATALVLALGTHHVVLAVLLLAFVWTGYTVFRASYTLFIICFTGYVVLLLTLSGFAGPLAAQYRILDTIAGGMIALLIYAAWPTWESGRARESLALLLDALADDARVLLEMVASPSAWDPQALRRSRDAARLARSNAEASVERMLAEPETARRITPQLALGILTAARRYALGALALHAALGERPDPARPAVAALRDQIRGALARCASRLRRSDGDRDPRLATLPLALPDDDIDTIRPELEMMVDALNSMARLTG